MKEVRTVAEIIESLKGYDENEKIAVQWWMDVDFEGYEDTNQALSLAQTYLDNLNPDITDYVDDLYEGENKCVCTNQPPYQECLEHSGY